MDEGRKREKSKTFNPYHLIGFNNNDFLSSQSIGNPQFLDENQVKKKNNGFFGKVGNFFEKTATKIKEMQIADKTKKIIESSTKWVDEKSKKVIVK